jgi:hypothetical protein
VRIKPQPAGLMWGKIRVPTLRGPVELAFSQDPGVRLRLEVFLPSGTSGQIWLPVPSGREFRLMLDGERCSGVLSEGWAIFEDVAAGWHVCEVSACSDKEGRP